MFFSHVLVFHGAHQDSLKFPYDPHLGKSITSAGKENLLIDHYTNDGRHEKHYSSIELDIQSFEGYIL